LATVKPFQPFRYSAKAGDPAKLVTQPYDKISPETQAKYLAASPYNLVRIILGERHASDGATDNVYTRAAASFQSWIREGILVQDSAPAFFAYFQDFETPDSGERFTRKGFICLGKLHEYSEGVVYRHEQTLTGPKQDRLELLRHTRAHFEQLFLLYPDPDSVIDNLLDEAATAQPALDVIDDYGARHRVWPISDATRIDTIQALMEPKKLLIADGHHRYETALAYRAENPAAEYVVMTLFNMHSPGLKILATHRVLRNVAGFDAGALIDKARTAGWQIAPCASLAWLKQEFATQRPSLVRIGVVGNGAIHLLERKRREGELDVPILHQEILGELMGIDEEAVRDERHIKYVRGIDAAAAEVMQHGAQVAFLLEPTPIDDMARIAFAGGVMPQKSTDFYPKLLSGLTIYKLD
jgi:uncharacterized protein (DUF1015 family)